MRSIDQIADTMGSAFTIVPLFPGVGDLIEAFAAAAKHKCETLRTDEDIFGFWSVFVVAG